MNTENPKVSVVIPVYNSYDYLPATLESVQKQTYLNLEVLLIDDGSTDGSAELCDRFCLADHRFHVYHRSNSGVSASRNFALDLASGDYCVFIDADDLVKENYIEVMTRIATATDSSLVVCNFMDGKYHSSEEFFNSKPENDPLYREIRIQDYRYTNQYAHDTVWGGLYRRDLIGDLHFDLDLFVGEDTVFFSRLLRRARNLVYVESSFYYYTYRYNSLARREYNRNLYTEVLAWERVCEEAAGEDPVFINECYVALAIRCRKNYELAVNAHYTDRELMKALLKRSFELRHCVYKSQERTTAEKIKYALFLRIPFVFTVLKLHAKQKKASN